MAATEASPDHSAQAAAPPAAPAAPPAWAGDPNTVGLPSFILGVVSLGLTLVGVVPATAGGAPLAIILAATSTGLLVTTIWAAALGQSAVAGVYGIFFGFWLSYGVLVLGLGHNWFGPGTTAAAVSTVELFLITWLIIVVMLMLASLRLPLAFTAIFALVAVAVVLILISYEQASAGLAKAGGYFVLASAAVGIYVFFNSLSVATGGKPLSLGTPVLHG